MPRISLIECNLETGRTHQIRVHLKYKGASLIGDDQYGKKNRKYKRSIRIFYKNLSNLKVNAFMLNRLVLFIQPKRNGKI